MLHTFMYILAQQLIYITNFIRIIFIEIHTLTFKYDYIWHLQTVKKHKKRMIANSISKNKCNSTNFNFYALPPQIHLHLHETKTEYIIWNELKIAHTPNKLPNMGNLLFTIFSDETYVSLLRCILSYIGYPMIQHIISGLSRCNICSLA